jgi:hypothetical protein
MGESGKKEYPLTDFCPKYTSADQVYLCGGPNVGEIGIEDQKTKQERK